MGWPDSCVNLLFALFYIRQVSDQLGCRDQFIERQQIIVTRGQ